MNKNSLFGPVTKAKLDELQAKEDYTKCSELYASSSLDQDSPELRSIKQTLYKILADYLLYDPDIDELLSCADIKPNLAVFSSIHKDDGQYGEKMMAILLVLYYCIKNRSYNYALLANASHEEISQHEYLREWLEDNADNVLNGHTELQSVFSALMVLLYDKLLGATVELVHSGKDVPVGVNTFHVGGGYAYNEIVYHNTTKVQKINALKLKGMEQYREECITRRNYWKGFIKDHTLSSSKNTFLYDTYDLKEINAFLAQFDFKLFDIRTKYYKNYFCHFINPLSVGMTQIQKFIYTLTDNQKRLNALTKKKRDWPLSLILSSFFKALLPIIPIAIIAGLVLSLFGEEIASGGTMVVMLICALIFFTPPYNRMRENTNRRVYSLLK